MGRKLAVITTSCAMILAFGVAGASIADAAPKPVVSGAAFGERSGTGHVSVTAFGNKNNASGSFVFTDTSGATFTGKVTCTYRKGNRVVVTGPVDGQVFGTEALVLWFQDGGPNGAGDAFDAAGTSLDAAAKCATNFPLNHFDVLPPSAYYVVTSGDIAIK